MELYVNKGKLVGLEEGYKLLEDFANGLRDTVGYAWAVLMEQDGKYYFWERYSQPCQTGGMRPYADITHNGVGRGFQQLGYITPEYAEKDLLPASERIKHMTTDLYFPFPPGFPVGLAVHNAGVYRPDNKLLHFVWGPDSPWRSVLTHTKIHKQGVVVYDTMVDATILMNLIRKTTGIHGYTVNFNKVNNLLDVEELTAFVLATTLMGGMTTIRTNEYSPFMTYDLSRIMNANPIDHSDGGKFRQRYAYNRTKQDYVWGEGNHRVTWSKAGVLDKKWNADNLLKAAQFLESLIK